MPTPTAKPGRLLMSAEYLEIRRDDSGEYWLLARRTVRERVHVFCLPLDRDLATGLACLLFVTADAGEEE